MTMPLQDMLGGKYEILEKIGEGGIGSVYKVKHRLLEEIRVIKVLRPQAASKEDLQRRFLREAKMAIRLKHPNIAQIYDFSVTDEGTAYLVMEFIDGVGLDAVLKATGPPSVDLTIELSRQALLALDYLHSQKFVHRDISPDNMMLATDHSGGPVVKLIDLGIAKNLESVAQLTQTGVFLGKVRYSSPEQFSAKAGSEDLDHRSDIYSFGVMLYQLLTGEYPFEGESFTELAGCHLFQAPRPFDTTDKEGRVKQELRETVLKAVEKEPDNRFASAAEFAKALAGFRDPDIDLDAELDTTVQATLAAMPKLADFKGPGSTQSRLDRDFGLVTTPEPSTVGEIVDQKTTVADPKQLAKDAARIDKLIAAGNHVKAQRMVTKALAKHGEAEPLLRFRNRLAEATTSVTPGSPKAAAGTETGGVFPFKLVGIGAAALLALAAVAWFVLQRGGAPEATGEVAETVAIDLGVRFDPDMSEPDLTFRVVPEPPENGSAGLAAENRPVEAGPSTGGPRPGGPPPGGPPPGNAADLRPKPGSEGQQRTGPGADRPPLEGRPPAGAQGGPPPPRERTQEIYKPGAVGVVPPVLISLPAPVVPDPPRTDTTIMVTALVDEHGNVVSTTVKRPAFKRKLKEAAMEAAKSAKFRPAVRNGVAGRMYTFIRVNIPAG